MMRPARVIRAATLLLPLTLLLGCTPSPTATTVDVTLQEWAVVVDDTSVPTGEITFSVTNDGPNDVHEFVIIRTDLDPGDLPTDATGTVDEAGAGMEVVDEIEDLAVGDTQEVTVTLEAGSYVLLCNIYSADEDEAHYAEGMRIAFTVE
jgi:methionine-rich copper-binding protein CopC